MSESKKLVEAAESSLEALSELAVTDLPTFENLVNPKAGNGPRTRFDQFNASGRKDPGPVPPIMKIDEWRPTFLETMYTRVIDAQAAACTNFAFASAYLLDVKQRLKKTDARIEVVGWTGGAGIAHVYVIVGRKPVFAKGRGYPLADADEWGDDWYVVDGWAGALGWDVVYKRGKNYPFDGMVSPLGLVLTNQPIP